MGVQFEQVTVTLAGSETSGNRSTTRPVIGKILAIHLDYSNIADTNADVTIATVGNTIPAQTIMVRSNSVTDGWFYPRAALHDATATPLTFDGTRAQTGLFVVHDTINVAIGTADAGSLVATILYED